MYISKGGFKSYDADQQVDDGEENCASWSMSWSPVETEALCQHSSHSLHRRWFSPVMFFSVTAAPIRPCTNASPVDFICLAL